jgi:hypothetical protein
MGSSPCARIGIAPQKLRGYAIVLPRANVLFFFFAPHCVRISWELYSTELQ